MSLLPLQDARAAQKRTAVKNKLLEYQQNPARFFYEVLGFEPWSKQEDLANLIRSNHYVMCRSGHKCGKTTALAAVALWYISCFKRSRVVMTAPAAPQIERGIWGEVKRLYRQAAERGRPLGGTLNETPWSGLTFADGRDVFGRSTKKKENFAGISAPNLLLLVDEASGIEEDIWEAIYGNLGGNGRVAGISNPTQVSGRFYDAFHSSRDQWSLLHISSTDTPNFHGGNVDGLATPKWAKFMEQEYGNPSAYYDVRVLGNFPSQSEYAVIGLAEVEAAVQRGKIVEALEKGTMTEAWKDEVGDKIGLFEGLVFPPEALTVGVDVARFGDDSTVFVPNRGLRMFEPKILHNMDVMDVAGHAHAFARSLARPGENPLLRVDANGIGAGVYDNLRRRDFVRAQEINVSEKAIEAERFVQTRDELWFGMRDWLRRGGVLPSNAKRLHGELVTPTYSFDNKGRYKVESKKDIKERVSGHKSPDVADAACLAVARALKVSRAKQLKELRGSLRGRAM